MSDRFNRPPESIRDIQLKGKVHYLSAKERLRLSATAPPYIPSDVGPNSEFDPNNSLPFYAPRPYEETVQRASAVLFNIRSDRHGVLHHSPSDVQDLLVLAKELSTEESISTSDVDANDFAFARAAERSHVEATVPVLACDTPLDLLDTNLDNAVYAVLKSLPSIPAHENPYQELEDEGLRLQPPPIQQATTCLDLDSSTSNGTKTQARKNSRRIRTVKSHRNGFVRENEDQLYTVHPSRRLMRDLDSFKIPADIRSLVPTSPACPVLEKLVPPQVRFSSSPTPGQLARAILETKPHDLSDRILRKFRITRPVSSLRSYRRALESLGSCSFPAITRLSPKSGMLYDLLLHLELLAPGTHVLVLPSKLFVAAPLIVPLPNFLKHLLELSVRTLYHRHFGVPSGPILRTMPDIVVDSHRASPESCLRPKTQN